MKSTAEKSSTTTSTTVTQASNQPFFAKAGGGNFFAPATHAAPAVQLKLAVNKPGDKFEQEADKMADKVMRMPAPAKEEKPQRQPEEKVQKKENDKLQKAQAPEEKLQRKGGDGVPAVSGEVQSAIRSKTAGGQPMSSDVRSYMEPRFNADFSNVRVHNDPEAASLNNQLSARAFTYQNHVFFSRDQYQPGNSEGKQLLAHELTHTIQQGHAVQRSPQVSTTTTPPPVQRLGIQDALDYFADKASNIPGYTMLTFLLGFNPINMRSVSRTAANLLRALIELIPGGHLITQALDNHGVINKAATWVEQKIAILGNIGGDIVAGLKRFIDSLSWTDIFHLGSVWDRAKRIFTDPIGRLIDFGVSVAVEILKMVKDAILKPLAALAQGTRGYELLKAILGEDPITGEPVPRNADTLVGGFMKLIGQEEVWENIKKGNAIGRAWAWFQGALEGLMGFVRTVPRKIINTLTSLTFADIITVVGAFTKIVSAFVNIAVDFISWGLKQVLSLLEILFSVVAPGVMPYIKKAQAAFATIIKNPIGFVGNLVRAGKRGFELFAGNILEHLKAALIKWLVGPLADAGVYIPKSFSLIEIVKLVLSVLGLTWQNIRTKLLKIIPEPVLVVIEKTAAILVTLVKDGPAAAWDQIKTELSELKDQLIAQVTQMITTEVVKAAVVKLVSMLNPAGAVIQAIIAIYNTVTFFIQKIQQIAAVVASFIDSISAIASGQVENAAKKVEQTMANTLVVVIGFLAKFAGLGNIPEKLVGVVKKIRQPIDKGLDKIVDWLGNMLKNLKSKAKSALGWIWSKVPFTGEDGKGHQLYISDSNGKPKLIMESTPTEVRNYLNRVNGDVAVISDANRKSKFEKLMAQALPINDSIEADSNALETVSDQAAQGKLQKTIQVNTNRLTPILSQLTAAGTQSADLPAMLPPMTNGVKARGTIAEFITRKKSNGSANFSPGTEASAYGGQTLGGWQMLQAAGLTTASRYVKMHLIPSRLGGDAVDSNLTPAPGSINLNFSSGVEMPAWIAANIDYIWYKTTISYHGGAYPNNAYPSFISSEWGDYDKNKQPWVRTKRAAGNHFYSASVPLPSVPTGLSINSAPDRQISDFFNISTTMAQLIVRLRRINTFNSGIGIINALDNWFANTKHVRPMGWEADVSKTGKQLVTKAAQIIY